MPAPPLLPWVVSVVMPPLTVKPDRVVLNAGAPTMVKTRKPAAAAGSRRTVRLAAPGPLTVSPWEAVGRAVNGETVRGVLKKVASKAMVSSPAAALASVMARRSEPAPESLALCTVNVVGTARPARALKRRPARRFAVWRMAGAGRGRSNIRARRRRARRDVAKLLRRQVIQRKSGRGRSEN